jgi:hypothetical protein
MAAPPSCQLGVHERLVALRIFDVLTHINVQLGLIQVYNCGASAISVPTRPRASEFQFAPALPVSSSAIPSGRNDDRTAAIEPPRAGPAIAEFFSFLTNDLTQSTFRISQHRSGWWQ